MQLMVRATFAIAVGVGSWGCGRLGFDAYDRDASPAGPVDAASTSADGPGPLDAGDQPPDAGGSPSDPDAGGNGGACTTTSECGAISACVAGQCVPARRIFVTSTSSNAAFGGLEAGDARCQTHADAAQLGGTWRAWLSSFMTHASNRLTHSTLPYRRLDGELIAADWNALTSGALANPINLDETLELRANVEVWTGTNAMGLKTQSMCADWTNDTENTPYATVGLTGATNTQWTSAYLQFCDRTNVRLYCIEQ